MRERSLAQLLALLTPTDIMSSSPRVAQQKQKSKYSYTGKQPGYLKAGASKSVYVGSGVSEHTGEPALESRRSTKH